jgi:hypothetical protein
LEIESSELLRESGTKLFPQNVFLSVYKQFKKFSFSTSTEDVMLRNLRNFALALAVGAAPLLMAPVQAHAQWYGYGGQNNDTQRAYQAGYNNGVNDRNKNKSLNLRTDNWKGVNLQAYERGYQDGYRSSGGYGRGNGGTWDGDRDRDRDHDRDRDRDREDGYRGGNPYGGGQYGGYAQNNDTQRAYQAGYNNGTNDRMRNKSLNLRTDNWRGVNLQAYERGYREGYRSGGRGR